MLAFRLETVGEYAEWNTIPRLYFILLRLATVMLSSSCSDSVVVCDVEPTFISVTGRHFCRNTLIYFYNRCWYQVKASEGSSERNENLLDICVGNKSSISSLQTLYTPIWACKKSQLILTTAETSVQRPGSNMYQLLSSISFKLRCNNLSRMHLFLRLCVHFVVLYLLSTS